MKTVYEHPDYRMEVMGKITEEQIYEREYVMLYVVSGQITATVDLQVYLLGEGELLLTNPLSHIRLSMEDTAVYSKRGKKRDE